ncbi:MAG: hypothetical protein ACI9AR_000397 [Flavobacteriaceae bacterium]|jgi:hypothetical protein
MKKISNINHKKGFVILFAVLITSVILAVAIGVSNIALREVGISQIALRSHDAFYVADTAMECVLAAERNTSPVAFPREGEVISGATISCARNNFNIKGGGGLYTVVVDFGSICAVVTIDKTIDNDDDGFPESTIITSRGKNRACLNTSKTVIERVLELSYTGDLSV